MNSSFNRKHLCDKGIKWKGAVTTEHLNEDPRLKKEKVEKDTF